MDLTPMISRFFDKETGDIVIPDEVTIAGLSEMFHQMDQAAGTLDRVALRYSDFSRDRDGEIIEYSRRTINTRIKAVAARLQQVNAMGQRVAIMANNSPEYLFGFLGALYAAACPVPLYDPNEPGHAEHLAAVCADANPAVVLTNKRTASVVRSFFSDKPAAERPRILAIDALPDTLAEQWQPPRPPASPEGKGSNVTPADTVALLQYTSGSTRTPAGVVLTHRAVLVNVLQTFTNGRLGYPFRMVTWLPMHHDMGIIMAMFNVVLGSLLDVMEPRDFVQQPSRWLKLLSRRADEEYVYSVIPNFSLELAARYAGDTEGLDLSAVDGLVLGAEPVTEAAINAFTEVFEKHGLKRTCLRPTYGMAESTVLLATAREITRPIISYFDRDDLAQGVLRSVEKSDTTVSYVSIGQPAVPQDLTIVDPDTRRELPDGQIGEIWAHGQNLASCYFNRPEETVATFENTLERSKRLEHSRVPKAPEDKWLATGDLGGFVEGELYLTSRLKDLIVIAGRNHYPQDVEFTVLEAAGSHLRPNSTAAFAIPGEDVEKLVILAERDFGATEDGDEEAVKAIRAAVTDTHGIQPYEVLILPPDGIARSSSGKIARRVCQQKYLVGEFSSVH